MKWTLPLASHPRSSNKFSFVKQGHQFLSQLTWLNLPAQSRCNVNRDYRTFNYQLIGSEKMRIEQILYSCCVAKVNENFEDGIFFTINSFREKDFGSSHVKSCVSLASTYTKKRHGPIDHAPRVFHRLPQSQRLQVLTSTTCQTHQAQSGQQNCAGRFRNCCSRDLKVKREATHFVASLLNHECVVPSTDT